MATLVDVGETFLDGYLQTLEHHGVKGMKWGQHVAAGKGRAAAVKKEGKSAHLLTGKERAEFNKNHPNVKKGYLTNAQRAIFYKNHPHAVVGKKIAPGAGHKGSHAESGGHKSAASHKSASTHKPSGVHIRSPFAPKKSVTPGRTPKAKGSHTPAGHVHSDAAKHAQLNETVQQHGTRALSNEDLSTLVSRMRLLQQHQQLTSQAASSAPQSVGQKVAGEGRTLAVNAARGQAQQLVNKGAGIATDAAVKAVLAQIKKRRG